VVVTVGDARLRPGDVPAILDALRSSHVGGVVVGMGLGRHPETLEATRSLLRELAGTVPLVVDADALDALPRLMPATPTAPVVATPNQGEFERVFAGDRQSGTESRLAAAKEVARARGVTVVVKGGEDVIAGGERTAVSGPHSRSMNVGGSGDVLAGVIGRLLAEGLDPVLAARLACQWCGDTGAPVAAQTGDGLVATDLIDVLPIALVAGIRAARMA
jgi:NAD(P)H-hydrate epimerase